MTPYRRSPAPSRRLPTPPAHPLYHFFPLALTQIHTGACWFCKCTRGPRGRRQRTRTDQRTTPHPGRPTCTCPRGLAPPSLAFASIARRDVTSRHTHTGAQACRRRCATPPVGFLHWSLSNRGSCGLRTRYPRISVGCGYGQGFVPAGRFAGG